VTANHVYEELHRLWVARDYAALARPVPKTASARRIKAGFWVSAGDLFSGSAQQRRDAGADQFNGLHELRVRQ
jgi:hypothetical protein